MTEKEQDHIFKEWLAKHRALIFKIVRAYAHTAPERDDLFQEISIQVWRSIPAFRGDAAVTTWLYRLSLNTAIKWTRKERKHQQQNTLESATHLLEENKDAMDDHVEWLYTEIHKLDSVDRSITLLLLDGFSYKEMAVILGISESHVGVKINRIKKQLITKSKNNEHNGI